MPRLSAPAQLVITCCLLLVACSPLLAQGVGGTVTVTVRHAGQPVADAIVRSGSAGALTDRKGIATLQLSTGPHTLIVRKVGFQPDTMHLALPPGRDTTIVVALVEQAAELAPIIVSATRTERRLEDEPERVEVLAGEDVAEKAEMRPGDLRVLLTEMSGVRVHPTAPGIGGAGIRIEGLRGQYTKILTDGLPLAGSDAAGLGLLQVPPLDLQQAEVIKGAATALYGPSALGGVVDLISRRPADEHAVLLNQTSHDGTDGELWLSQQVSERWGYTFLGGAHRQRRVDVNRDGWADIPGYKRAEVRPRLFWTDAHGGSVMATLGAMTEDRTGGSMVRSATTTGAPYAEDVDTRRVDAGLVGRFPLGTKNVIRVRGSVTGRWQRLRFGPSLEHDRQATLFGEATVTHTAEHSVSLVGVALEQDGYRAREVRGLDYTFTTPSLFAQTTLTPVAPLALSLSGRCDSHSRYGTICSPRASVLIHVTHVVSTRLSAGTGFFAPTPFTEETVGLELSRIQPLMGLVAERARNASLDVTATRGPLEMNATLFASVIEHAVGAREVPGDTSHIELINATGPTRTYGAELYAIYNREPIVATAYYGYLRSTERDVETGIRRDVPLDPRHSAGLDVAWEEDELGTRVGVEMFYTGRQALEHDPYRTMSPSYTTLGLLVSQQIGGVLVYVNGENLTDVRQTRTDPLLLPSPGFGGAWTTPEWASLGGREVNAGVRVAF